MRAVMSAHKGERHLGRDGKAVLGGGSKLQLQHHWHHRERDWAEILRAFRRRNAKGHQQPIEEVQKGPREVPERMAVREAPGQLGNLGVEQLDLVRASRGIEIGEDSPFNAVEEKKETRLIFKIVDAATLKPP